MSTSHAHPLHYDVDEASSSQEPLEPLDAQWTDTQPTGAPVEKVNPLGKEVTLWSAVTLNIGQITGSGIYATPGVVLGSVGSVGVLLIYWVIAPIFAFAGLSLYIELASMFPRRSGAEVVYLEQAYPRPRYLVSSTFAVMAVLLSLSASNAIVFAQYFLTALELPVNDYNQTVTALLVVFCTIGCVALSTRWSLRLVNLLTIVKILSLVFLSCSGLAVLSGFTHIRASYENFRHPFRGSSSNLNALATSMVKVNHAFVGWHNAFNVLGEIKGSNPVKTVKNASLISLSAVSFLFFLVNVAYVAVVPVEEIKHSGQLVAALFFHRVFGYSVGVKILPLFVAISCVGNIIAVTVGQSRIIREVARQGLLPYPTFFSSTKPFGTPIGPVFIKGFLTVLALLLLPARDAFNFLLDLVSYPNLIFQCAMCVGVWILRRRRALASLPRSIYQARNNVVCLYLASCIFLLVMPWVPPESGHGDVSFWYATYCVTGIVLLLLCGLYYFIWIFVLPSLGGYEIIEEMVELPNGACNVQLVRRYKNLEDQPLLQSE